MFKLSIITSHQPINPYHQPSTPSPHHCKSQITSITLTSLYSSSPSHTLNLSSSTIVGYAVAIYCSSVAHGVAEVNASLAHMVDSSMHTSPRGSQDLLPSPRHIPISEDQRNEASFNPGNDGKDKLTTLLNEVKSLQDQIVQIQHASQEAQVNEPFEKKIRVCIDDHKTHLLEIRARMQQQEQTHEFQMSRLKESMTKAQADIQYLLAKTKAQEEGASAGDQPRRTMDRAASGQKLNILQGRQLPLVDPLPAQPDQPPKPFLLLTNSGQA